MRWLACAIVLLAVGCTPVVDDPRHWVIGHGPTLADPQDYDDCLHKARYSETFASGSGASTLQPPSDRPAPAGDLHARSRLPTEMTRRAMTWSPARTS
jgi:hypothetical protein